MLRRAPLPGLNARFVAEFRLSYKWRQNMSKNPPPEVQAILSAMDARHFATAASLLEKYLDENPTSQRGWIDLGTALSHLGRYERAEQAYLQAVALDESKADGIMGAIGHLHRSRGDFSTAMTWYQKQVDLAPDDSTGWLYLGNIQLNQGDAEAALASFQHASKCKSGCREEVHYSMGLAYRSAGELFQAKSEFEKAVQLDPKFEAAKVALKDVSKAKGL